MAIAAFARASMFGLVVFALSVSMPAAQQAGAQGETWEHTMQATASGMSMPAQTMTACQAKGAERAEPAPQMPDESCTMTTVQNAGSRTSFKVTCTQPEPMSGTGEVTWDGQKSSYTSTMTMTSSDGTITMKTSGKRLGAACDPRAEAKAQADQFAGIGQADVAKACAESVAEGNPALFSGAKPICADSTVFCKNFRTEAGFAKAALYGDVAGGVCKVNTASLRADLCGTALKNESLGFLGSSCPEQLKVVVQRECPGRTFTSVNEKYKSICTETFAAALAAKGAATAPASTTATPAAPTPADVKGGAVEGAKRRLGGLIRR